MLSIINGIAWNGPGRVSNSSFSRSSGRHSQATSSWSTFDGVTSAREEYLEEDGSAPTYRHSTMVVGGLCAMSAAVPDTIATAQKRVIETLTALSRAFSVRSDLLLRARTAEDVEHRVVAFVTRVLVHHVAVEPGHGTHRGPWTGVDARVLEW